LKEVSQSQIQTLTKRLFNKIRLKFVLELRKGPFSTFVIPSETPTQVTHIKFSNDGSFILLATNENILYLLDAYDGHLVQDNKKKSLEFSDLMLLIFPFL
jgi:hypothetical protein